VIADGLVDLPAYGPTCHRAEVVLEGDDEVLRGRDARVADGRTSRSAGNTAAFIERASRK